MRVRRTYPEPFETLIARAGSVSGFQAIWNIPFTTLSRWVKKIEAGQKLPHSARFLIEQMGKAAKKGQHAKGK